MTRHWMLTTILVGISIIHIVWGMSLILHPISKNLLILVGGDFLLKFFASGTALGATLIFIGGCSLIAYFYENKIGLVAAVFLAFPQFLIVNIAIVVDVYYIILKPELELNSATGTRYVTLSRWTFLDVLLPFLVLAIIHWWAFLERFIVGRLHPTTGGNYDERSELSVRESSEP